MHLYRLGELNLVHLYIRSSPMVVSLFILLEKYFPLELSFHFAFQPSFLNNQFRASSRFPSKTLMTSVNTNSNLLVFVLTRAD